MDLQLLLHYLQLQLQFPLVFILLARLPLQHRNVGQQLLYFVNIFFPLPREILHYFVVNRHYLCVRQLRPLQLGLTLPASKVRLLDEVEIVCQLQSA